MSISERADLAVERIIRWSTISELTPEEWMLRMKREIERSLVETVISCAMSLEQDFPRQMESENGELVGGATGGYLRTYMDTIVAGIDIEEDHSIDVNRLTENIGDNH